MIRSDADELFSAARLGNYNDDEPWEAVSKLRLDGDAYIFDRAAEWCASEHSLLRARGAAILCQLREPVNSVDRHQTTAPILRDEALAIIAAMPQRETDAVALSSEIHALGHLDFASAIPLITNFTTHPNEDVRFAVAFALSCFPDNPSSVEHLILLTDDESAEVRDWALFGLGRQSSCDSDQIRIALVRRLSDPSEDVQHEAAAGLAKRRDPRAVAPLIRLLKNGWYYSHLEESLLTLLDLQSLPDGWGAEEFVAALRSRYPARGAD